MTSGAEAARLKDELRTRELEIELLQQVRDTSVTVDVCRTLYVRVLSFRAHTHTHYTHTHTGAATEGRGAGGGRRPNRAHP